MIASSTRFPTRAFHRHDPTLPHRIQLDLAPSSPPSLIAATIICKSSPAAIERDQGSLIISRNPLVTRSRWVCPWTLDGDPGLGVEDGVVAIGEVDAAGYLELAPDDFEVDRVS